MNNANRENSNWSLHGISSPHVSKLLGMHINKEKLHLPILLKQQQSPYQDNNFFNASFILIQMVINVQTTSQPPCCQLDQDSGTCSASRTCSNCTTVISVIFAPFTLLINSRWLFSVLLCPFFFVFWREYSRRNPFSTAVVMNKYLNCMVRPQSTHNILEAEVKCF